MAAEDTWVTGIADRHWAGWREKEEGSFKQIQNLRGMLDEDTGSILSEFRG
jgi:hypothetical protein